MTINSNASHQPSNDKEENSLTDFSVGIDIGVGATLLPVGLIITFGLNAIYYEQKVI
jgi:hypothetical protein